MIAEYNQRWRDRRASFRPAGETINPSEFDVCAISSDATARRFVLSHHYSGTYPAARRRFGLYRRGLLEGVAVFSVPCSHKVFSNVFPTLTPNECVELGRFVLTDEVAGNGETWFLARCFELLRHDGFAGVVSFSDPHERTTRAGARVFPGHIGTIYQAHNARYLGRGTARKLALLPDGRVLSPRSMQKIRAAERGWLAAVTELQTYGAPALDAQADDLDRRAWLNATLRDLTRPLHHGGNFKYAWGLTKTARRLLSATAQATGSLSFPKSLPLAA
jgi:hypothetical protein